MNMNITKEDFKAYHKVQKAGLYNMLDQRAIMATGLSREKYFEIIKNYEKYYNMYK